MTVFIAFAEADRPVAASLAAFLQSRAFLAELVEPGRPLRPLMGMERLVSLWSGAAMTSPYRFQLESMALAAWAEQRLHLVKLDHAFLPLACADLPFLDAAFAPRREFLWQDLAVALRARPAPPPPAELPDLTPEVMVGAAGPRPEGGVPPAPRAPQPLLAKPEAPAPAAGGGLFWGGLFAIIVLAGGAWMFSHPATAPPLTLPQGPQQLAFLRLSLPFGEAGSAIAALALALALGAAALALVLRRAGSKPKRRARTKRSAAAPAVRPAPAPAASPAAEQPSLFISYASADAEQVLPVVDAIRDDGLDVWIDRQAMQAGEHWAGEIVGAIRSAGRVLVMCSQRAFQSPHVLREVYLAGHFRKPLVPVFLEEAEPPDDFLYHFAGVQHLRLYALPAGERPRVLAQAARG